LRFSAYSTSKASRSLPQGSLAFPRKVTGSVISLVTSRIVRFPVTSKASSPFFTIFVLAKVIAGKRSAAKKSSDRRCLSRAGSLVSMLAVRISRRTDDCSGAASS